MSKVRKRVLIVIDDDLDEVEAVAMVLVTMEQGRIGAGGEHYPLRTNFSNGYSVTNNRERQAIKFTVGKSTHIR
jgi:hypothetical protein